jgi:hypothetical protein
MQLSLNKKSQKKIQNINIFPENRAKKIEAENMREKVKKLESRVSSSQMMEVIKSRDSRGKQSPKFQKRIFQN